MKLLALSIPASSLWALTLAQTTGDPISGGAGWVGAGLLGLVMAWLLLVHLPAKDKQIKEMVDAKDATVADLTTSYTAQLAADRKIFLDEQGSMRDTFHREMSAVRDQHYKERGELVSLVNMVVREFRTAVHDVRGTAQAAVSRGEQALYEAAKAVDPRTTPGGK